MKKITIISILLILAISCTTDNASNQSVDVKPEQAYASFFEKNMAIIDISIMSISKSHYIKELKIKNFSETKWEYEVFSTQNGVYLDNGQYNDKKAGDGIYTSMDTFEYDKDIKYNKDQPKESIINAPIFNSKFEYTDDLIRYTDKAQSTKFTEMNYPSSSVKPGGEIGLTCDIEFGTCQCRAHSWGWCNCCCAQITNCKFSIKIKI